MKTHLRISPALETGASESGPSAWLRRVGIVTGILALGLGLSTGVVAQSPVAAPPSPATPTPYSWPLFHAGGGPFTPLTSPVPNPLARYLQGTPTGLLAPGTTQGTYTTNTGPTEIPSFLLGNYDPSNPPGAFGLNTGATVNNLSLNPNHFRDGGIFRWAAPFPTTNPNNTLTDTQRAALTVDDSSTTAFALAGNGWTTITDDTATPDPADPDNATPTYRRIPVRTRTTAIDTTGTPPYDPVPAPSATWTVTIPPDTAHAGNGTGAYTLGVHIPDRPTDGSENRIADARYTIDYTDLNGTARRVVGYVDQSVGSTLSLLEDAPTGGAVLSPIYLYVDGTNGATLTVTVDNTTAIGTANGTNAFVIADSVTFKPASGTADGAVDSVNHAYSSPVAVNATEYPEIANARYFGSASFNSIVTNTANGFTDVDGTGFIDNNGSSLNQNGTLVSPYEQAGYSIYPDIDITTGLGVPRGNTSVDTGYVDGVIKTGPAVPGYTGPDAANVGPAGNSGLTPVRTRAIRQLVYFARDEFRLETRQDVNGTAATPRYTGQLKQVGAIYCVDGFNGGVVWRYETPPAKNTTALTTTPATGTNGLPVNGQTVQNGGAVWSTPIVTRINVLVGDQVIDPGPPIVHAPVLQTKLVVIVADNSGRLYCLDAVGNRDGSSNSAAIDRTPQNATPTTEIPTANQIPITPVSPFGVPIYDPATPADATTRLPRHVGTTRPYWVYRPDATRPKYVAPVTTGQTVGDIKTTPDPSRDLPVPSSFNLASATVYVDPNIATDPTTNYPGSANTGTPLQSNATVYIGSSNGVMYAFDAQGLRVSGVKNASVPLRSGLINDGDPFNASLDIRQDTTNYNAGFDDLPQTDGFPYYDSTLGPTLGVPSNAAYVKQYADFIVPTIKPIWWFSTRGIVTGDNASTSNSSIDSAPAVYVDTTGNRTVYFGTSNEGDADSNIGFLYAVDGVNGPKGNGGLGTVPVGGVGYNIDPRPNWTFPDKFGTQTTINTSKKPREGLGNISGSPVIFQTPGDSTTRIYFAANSGVELLQEDGETNTEPVRAENGTTGRIWAIDTTGKLTWAYPAANDPNNVALDNTPEPSTPIGSFSSATPAIGIVQFPSNILYGNASPYNNYATTKTINGNTVAGRAVSMLYVGTNGTDDSSLYAISVDVTGNSTAADDERDIFVLPSPAGAKFQSSPALIVNATSASPPPTEGPGNGGAVFITADNTLYQVSATPVTNPASTQNAPLISVDARITGFGPLSSPSAAGANVFDLNNAAAANQGLATLAQNGNTTDYIYVGDNVSGLYRGITTDEQNGGYSPGDYFGFNGNPVDNLNQIDPSLQMYTYLFDGTTAHPAVSTNMAQANPAAATDPVTIFEWGQNIYIRFSNVVPPNPNNDPTRYVTAPVADPNADPASRVVYSDGGPITFQLQDDTTTTPGAAQNQARLSVPLRVLAKTGQNIRTTANGTIPSGFVQRDPNDPASGENASGALVGIVDPTVRWLGAYTYQIGKNGQSTPGAQKRVIAATQTVKRGHLVNNLFVQDGTATITATTTQGYLRGRTRTRGTNGQYVYAGGGFVGPSTQPAFSIANPLAVRGGGIPLQVRRDSPRQAQLINENPGNRVNSEGVGPFRAIKNDPMVLSRATPNYASDNLDLQALSNGNTVYTQSAPPAGTDVVGTNPTQASRNRRTRDRQFPQRNRRVTTTTGLINHNASGDNADPTNSTPTPGTGTTLAGDSLVGKLGTTDNNGLTYSNTNQQAEFGKYALNVADRSVLGLVGDGLDISMESDALGWNDNTPNGGPGAVVNLLPWEVQPGRRDANRSPDYPNIGGTAVTQQLDTRYGGSSGTLKGTTRTPDPATGADFNTNPQDRLVIADPIQVRVDVPRFQPANLQLFTTNQRAIPPTVLDRATATNYAFPMGYMTTEKIYVDSNKNRRWDTGEAYREVQVWSGVAMDLSTTISDTTTDIGKVPHGFGILTDKYAPLQNGDAARSGYTQPIGGVAVNNLFTPFNSAFDPYFKPMTVYNTGNVNLMNIHLDQKVNYSNDSDPANVSSLTLGSGPLDELFHIPAFDLNATTGSQQFLVRSSLDTDLTLAGIGRNPGIVANATPYANIVNPMNKYPALTFHKNRVGRQNPETLRVPDVPADNNPGTVDARLQPYVLNTSDRPGIDGNGNPFAARPYVSIAVPIGTPVGTYSQTLRLFEGMDRRDLTFNQSVDGPTDSPLAPPSYGNAFIDVNDTNNPDLTTLTDQFLLPRGRATQPYSDPSTTLKVTVTEERITDRPVPTQANPAAGVINGDIPQIAGQFSASDFLPSAFRDNNGNVFLSFTSSRGNVTPGTTASYDILSAVLPFGNAPTSPALYPFNPQGNWWSLSSTDNGLFAPNTGVNSAMSLTHEQKVFNGTQFVGGDASYGFVQNVASVPGQPALYANNLYCLQFSTTTGTTETLPAAGSVTAPDRRLVSSDPAQAKFGARGLKFSNQISFADPAGGAAISRDLWAFWYGGTRGRTSLYYSAASTDGSGVPTSQGGKFWLPTSVLPLPAGLASVSDPSPILTTAPDPTTGNPIPVIEVTYSGTTASGNADIYVSRYRPYRLPLANGAANTDANGIALGLVYSPPIRELLAPDSGRQYWQARDVAWGRNNNLNVFVNGTPIARDLVTGNLLNGVKADFDRATGTLVLTGVTLPTATGTVPGTAYINLASGNLRFSRILPAATQVEAIFNSGARRITTDSRSDTAPTAFLDSTFQSNTANSGGANPDLGRVQIDRYWTMWRKSGASGTATTPSLFYKTQRLTVVLTDRNGSAISLKLRGGNRPSPQQPIVTVTDVLTGTQLYTETSGGGVDIDWPRGRLYFPIVLGNLAMEGRIVNIAYSFDVVNPDGSVTTQDMTTTAVVHWMDEARYNDIKSLPGGGTQSSLIGAAATGDAQLPIDTVVNESNVAAFLDPLAFQNGPTLATNGDQPRKVWVFWTSTRNGTADIYYMTINPRFSAR